MAEESVNLKIYQISVNHVLIPEPITDWLILTSSPLGSQVIHEDT